MKQINKDFNYRITQYFLNRKSLTILVFLLLIVFGFISTLTLKTTGFPLPQINIAQITTTYQGASSDTVARDITKPIEAEIKDIEGIKNYESSSQNSFSLITVTIKEDADIDATISKIDSSVRGVDLPTGVDPPKIKTLEIEKGDYIFSIVSNNKDQLFDVYNQTKKDLEETPEIAKIETINDLKRKIQVVIDDKKLHDINLSYDDVKRLLTTVDQETPVISDQTIDGENKTIITTFPSEKSPEEILNIQFVVTPRPIDPILLALLGTQSRNSALSTDLDQASPIGNLSLNTAGQGQFSSQQGLLQYLLTLPKVYRLGDFATAGYIEKYDTTLEEGTQYTYKQGSASKISNSVTVSLRAPSDAPLGDFANAVENILSQQTNASFVKNPDSIAQTDKVLIIKNYSANDFNREQTKEIINGLVGAKLSTNGFLAYLGYLLGGVFLVIIVMMIFVSWRAGIIAALAIPLSLTFTAIYLLATKNTLNTLVLFSIVLVIGLVVDPAIVILESIQRKIDTGLKGNGAVLAAIGDVGRGLFASTLLNTIVFLPFAVVTGFVGEIFIFIPKTIIPSLIGSYIIALVILAWLGGLVLKPRKNAKSDEQANLWRISRWLIKLNRKILDSSWIIRFAIIFGLLFLSLGITYHYTSSRKVRLVQFSQTGNSRYIQLTGTFYPTTPKYKRDQLTKDVLKNLSKFPQVMTISPQSQAFDYQIEVKIDPEITTQQLTDRMTKLINQRYANQFFNIKVTQISNGPPPPDYDISLIIKSNDQITLESASKSVAANLANLCLQNKTYSIDPTCKNGIKNIGFVNDGYSGQQNKVLKIIFDRRLLAKKKLVQAGALPFVNFANTSVQQLFYINGDKKVGTINLDGDEIEIVADKSFLDAPTSPDLYNYNLVNSEGKNIPLRDVAIIVQEMPKETIKRIQGVTVNLVQARIKEPYNDQTNARAITKVLLDHYNGNDNKNSLAIGLKRNSVSQYSQGSAAEFGKSLNQLLLALGLAIILNYIILVIFFDSFILPLIILFSLPLTFIGAMPALAAFGGGQLGLLEIIGFIILTGLVVNVAIYLIDYAQHKIKYENYSSKEAISLGAGVRLRPVFLTKVTALASLTPLILRSEFYRSIAVVVLFGLLSSGITSLITTPILFSYINNVSKYFQSLTWWQKILFLIFWPVGLIIYAINSRKYKWI